MSIIGDFVSHTWESPVVEIPNVGRDDLALWFAEAGYTRGVEVGTERGEYAELLCKSNPSLYLDCVDPYRAYKDYRDHVSQLKLDAMYDEANHRLRHYKATFVRQFSVEASHLYDNGSLDFVYLDANHSLPYVIADLHAWVPKVRKGGVISGHDMIRRNNSLKYQCHVVEAVMAWTQCYMVQPLFIVGAKDKQVGIKRDTIRSFFWIKE